METEHCITVSKGFDLTVVFLALSPGLSQQTEDFAFAACRNNSV